MLNIFINYIALNIFLSFGLKTNYKFNNSISYSNFLKFFIYSVSLYYFKYYIILIELDIILMLLFLELFFVLIWNEHMALNCTHITNFCIKFSMSCDYIYF